MQWNDVKCQTTQSRALQLCFIANFAEIDFRSWEK